MCPLLAQLIIGFFFLLRQFTVLMKKTCDVKQSTILRCLCHNLITLTWFTWKLHCGQEHYAKIKGFLKRVMNKMAHSFEKCCPFSWKFKTLQNWFSSGLSSFVQFCSTPKRKNELNLVRNKNQKANISISQMLTLK